jgi:hypothetical protein
MPALDSPGFFPQLDLSSLHNFIAFAIGGLLGDVFFHLIPHAFMGGASEDPVAAASGSLDAGSVRLIVVEEKRNVILGVSVPSLSPASILKSRFFSKRRLLYLLASSPFSYSIRRCAFLLPLRVAKIRIITIITTKLKRQRRWRPNLQPFRLRLHLLPTCDPGRSRLTRQPDR